jgi:hypothetical protein
MLTAAHKALEPGGCFLIEDYIALNRSGGLGLATCGSESSVTAGERAQLAEVVKATTVTTAAEYQRDLVGIIGPPVRNCALFICCCSSIGMCVFCFNFEDCTLSIYFFEDCTQSRNTYLPIAINICRLLNRSKLASWTSNSKTSLQSGGNVRVLIWCMAPALQPTTRSHFAVMMMCVTNTALLVGHSPWIRDRCDKYLANKSQAVALHGEAAFESRAHFYSVKK